MASADIGTPRLAYWLIRAVLIVSVKGKNRSVKLFQFGESLNREVLDIFQRPTCSLYKV